eukprot:TRINITY_DN5405_c0_g1_i10.p1 TRINITY_DN5405_c0_g1~~TRINITY_DN5405_c0_g1_i10.p1  ORF type:complete len:229 (+),score=29.69 TRINITY_DN5405_c0_g1_i10:133-819(+)
MGIINCIQNMQKKQIPTLAEHSANDSDQDYSERPHLITEVPEFVTHESAEVGRFTKKDKKRVNTNYFPEDKKNGDNILIIGDLGEEKKLSISKIRSLMSPLKLSLQPGAENQKVKPSNFRIEKAGRISDTYKSLGVIAKGAYGEIRKVMNKHTSAIRAVKTISKTKCRKIDNLSEEIAILRELVLYQATLGPPERAALLRVLQRRPLLLRGHRVLRGWRPVLAPHQAW